MDGWELVAEGRQAQVYLRPDGTVVKLMREADDGPWIEREAAALRAVAGAGVAVPAVVGPIEVDGRPGLAMSRVEGTDLMTVVGARPWTVWPFAARLGTLHAALHDCPAPDALPGLRDVLAGRIDEAPDLSPSARAAARAALAELPDGDALCHGDMHLGNLIGDPADPVVIDWGGAARGDPTADVALTVLMHRRSQPGPGAPAVVRTLAPVGGWLIARRYLATYGRIRPLDRDQLERWVAVRAAARVADRIDDEDAGLRRIVADAFGT